MGTVGTEGTTARTLGGARLSGNLCCYHSLLLSGDIGNKSRPRPLFRKLAAHPHPPAFPESLRLDAPTAGRRFCESPLTTKDQTMTTPAHLSPEVIQAALKDGIQAIGVEFQASCNPLRVALGVILTNHPDAVFELMNTSMGKVFSPERANEVLRNIAEGVKRRDQADPETPPNSK